MAVGLSVDPEGPLFLILHAMWPKYSSGKLARRCELQGLCHRGAKPVYSSADFGTGVI